MRGSFGRECFCAIPTLLGSTYWGVRMKRLLMGLFCLLLAGAAVAGSANHARQSMQASMLVTGAIVVAPDGSVRSYTIDHAEKLPAPVLELIERGTKSWIFEPPLLDGQPVVAKASMSLRVVAQSAGKGDYAISLEGAQFGRDGSRPGESIKCIVCVDPRYPQSAIEAGVSGAVYLRVLVDRQGRVQNAIAEQVNMGILASDRELDKWRKVLADAALAAIKAWTFKIPTSGKDASQDHWEVQIPVSFNLVRDGSSPPDQYGKRDVYVPGPKQPVPWPEKAEAFSTGTDAIADGGLYQIGSGLHLTTPLNGA